MKIVLTVHQFLPDHASGTEILTYETAKELQRLGHTVKVFTGLYTLKELTDTERFDQYFYNGISVERFYFNYKHVDGQSNPIEIEYNNSLVGAYFKKYLEREKPDIVHSFHLAHLSASPIDACRELGIPVVLTPTDFWFVCPMFELRWPNNQVCPGPDPLALNCVRHVAVRSLSPRVNSLFQRIPNRLLRLFIRFVKKWGNIDTKYSPMVRALSERHEFLQKKINLIDKVIIPTQIMLSVLSQNGLEAHRIASIPFGLNLTYLQNAKRPEPGNILRLGYIGTLSEHKGVHVLVQAVRQLEDKPIELKIYGKLDEFPDYIENLRRIIQNDPRIKFCGTFPNREIGRIFSDLDALVVPSVWYENSPLVIYSAQAAKCPVIASNMDGLADVVEHGRNGLLFESGNSSQLAATINTIFKDKNLLQELSERSKIPLSIQAYAEKIVAIYQDLVKSGKIV